MGTKKNPGQYDCYEAAAPDEPMFVLLGRDPLAAHLVSLWGAIRNGDLEAADRIYDHTIKKNIHGYASKPDADKASEAAQCSVDMFKFREAREAARARVADIDAKFHDAEGWGSWMVSAANERETLADRYGFEHKHRARTAEGGRVS